MKIKELPEYERPRERLLQVGSSNLSNEELLSIIIKTGTKGVSVKEIALEILKRIKNINNLDNISINTFSDIKGLGEIKRIELLATIELGRRIFLEKQEDNKIIYNKPQVIFEHNKHLFYHKKQEYFYCLYLDNKNKLIERKLLFMGTVNRSIAHPREIFKEAYKNSASSIVCMHNHPSGDLTPSIDDIQLTESLIEIGRISGINVMDHLIISDNNYYSFYDNQKDLFI